MTLTLTGFKTCHLLLHLSLTLRLCECPVRLFPLELSEWLSEGWRHAQRWRRVEDSASLQQKMTKGRAHDKGPPSSRRSPAIDASDQKTSHWWGIMVAFESTWSSLSAAFASSPASESSLCRTGPSTERTWASSQREGYSLNERKVTEFKVLFDSNANTALICFTSTHSAGVPGFFYNLFSSLNLLHLADTS